MIATSGINDVSVHQ